jgi:hypothetical protein
VPEYECERLRRLDQPARKDVLDLWRTVRRTLDEQGDLDDRRDGADERILDVVRR